MTYLVRIMLLATVLLTVGSQSYSRADDGSHGRLQQQDPKRREITAEVLRSEDNMTITLKTAFPDETPNVKVSLFNLLGKLVEVHPMSNAVKGSNLFQFRTRGLPNGPYIIVLEASGQRLINKVMLSR